MRCPLCDGPVVNGRCKECGMPYRNDEILYHLNESREDHYSNASAKARRLMQAQQRTETGNTDTAQKNRRASTEGSGRTVSKQAIQEQQKKIRQEAMRKMTGSGTAQSSTGKKNRPEKKKKRSRFGIFWAIIILLAAVAPLFEDIGDAVKDYQNDKTEYNDSISTGSDTYFYSWDGDGYKGCTISAGFGLAEAGVQFDTGEYDVFTSSDEVTLVVNQGQADEKQYSLKKEDDSLTLNFEEGDTILVESEESEYDSVSLMEWED